MNDETTNVTFGHEDRAARAKQAPRRHRRRTVQGALLAAALVVSVSANGGSSATASDLASPQSENTAAASGVSTPITLTAKVDDSNARITGDNQGFSVESADFAHGFLTKERLSERLKTLVKPDAHALDPLSRRVHEALCRSFVLPELGQIARFTDTLGRHGFHDITVNEISWRVAPSALHAPLAVLSFSLKKALRRERLTEQSVNNLKGSLLSAALGLNRRKVGYFLVTGQR